MARSNGSAAAVVALGAVGYLLVSQLAAFVGISTQSYGRFRSRVVMEASQADVDLAKKAFDLQKWAADHLSKENSPGAAAAVARAQQAEAAYLAAKAAHDGAPAAAPAYAPPSAAAPAYAPPPAVAPVAAAPAAGGANKEELLAAKQNAQLLTWAAAKLSRDAHPQAAAMKARADQAVAAFEALKNQAGGAGPTLAPVAAPPPVAAAPATSTGGAQISFAPAPAAPASVANNPEVQKAKKEMELHEWAAMNLASQGSPHAANMQAKAAQSRAAYEALLASAR